MTSLEEISVVDELQQEVLRQSNLIRQLRQDNVNLRAELEIQLELTEMYASELESMKSQSAKSTTTVEEFHEDLPKQFTGGLSIKTKRASTPSEVYWTDNEDTVDISESEYCTAMQEISKADKNCGKKKIGFFFRGKTNKHNRSKSLKKKSAVPQKDSKEYKPSSKSTNAGRTKQQISSAVIESVDGGYLDSLLKSGWSGEDIGQKLLILRDSYAKHTSVFEDDVRFMREVLEGKSRAPEMDIEVELHKMLSDLKNWGREFRDSVKSLKTAVRKINKDQISETPKSMSRGHTNQRRTTVTSSIGRLFAQITPCTDPWVRDDETDDSVSDMAGGRSTPL